MIHGNWTIRLMLAALAAASCSGALADSVKLKSGVSYEDVTIRDVSNGTISFAMATGGQTAKALTEVKMVTIKGSVDFNAAEQAMADGKFADALAGYAKVEGGATGWKSTLVMYRAMMAAENAGLIDMAVQRWIRITDSANGAAPLLAVRPRRLAAAKDAANDRAINLVKSKIDSVKLAPYKRVLKELLVELYQRQNRLDEAAALAGELAGGGVPAPSPTPSTGGTTGTGAATAVEANSPAQLALAAAASAQLRVAGVALQKKEYAQVIQAVQPRLHDFSAADLPSALFMLGTAELKQAKAQQDPAAARVLLLAAGVDLMRVVAFASDSEYCGQSLLEAAEVNERLGNVNAARAAYTSVINRWGASELAKKASAALEGLKKTGK